MAKKRDRWPELCRLVEKPDGLPVRDVGPWTDRKLYFWSRYIEITTKSMVGKSAWASGLVYADLFAGPAVCEIRTSHRRIPGSALIAAHAPKQFRRILACEMHPATALACEKRLGNTAAASNSRVFVGDCNQRIRDIVGEIPDRALTLAFIDPEGLDAKFDTIEILTTDRRVDLLLLFADAYDVVRNVELLYMNDPNSRLDATLGPDSRWRDQWRNLANRDGTNVRKLFAEIYKSQLRRHLGYEGFGEYVIKSDRGPLYRLIYASKSSRGLDFWHKCIAKDEQGQMGFDF